MVNSVYATLTRQSGLMSEMQILANNIANAATTGYRAEGLIFSEHIAQLDPDDPSLSMSGAQTRNTSEAQGALRQTGGTFDVAIEGDGFFLLQTPQGERLTRAGHFMPNETGSLANAAGDLVLDPGGAPIFIPPNAQSVGIAADGTVSADGAPLAQIGIVTPINPLGVTREDGVRFRADDGYEPTESSRVVQGFLEASNVNPITELARMIDVQRSYELGQTFLNREDERLREAIRTLGQ